MGMAPQTLHQTLQMLQLCMEDALYHSLWLIQKTHNCVPNQICDLKITDDIKRENTPQAEVSPQNIWGYEHFRKSSEFSVQPQQDNSKDRVCLETKGDKTRFYACISIFPEPKSSLHKQHHFPMSYEGLFYHPPNHGFSQSYSS